MNLDDAPTYQLLQYSVRVCKHCAFFRTAQCTAVQGQPKEPVVWTSLSTCPAWCPNERADYSLQVLTYRKLSGHDEKEEDTTDDSWR